MDSFLSTNPLIKMTRQGFSPDYHVARRPLVGPETDLIEGFLLRLRVSRQRGERLSIFREPRLVTGFPDVVLVFWREALASRWSAARATLKVSDLQLVHLLWSSGPLDDQGLRRVSLLPTDAKLQRLSGAGLVVRRKGEWRATTLSEVFAVRRIVALEAKISNWSSALRQASANRWFATESYVLVPPNATSNVLLAGANAGGVGLWVADAPRPFVVPVTRPRQPVSFASWLFNEAVLRRAAAAEAA